MSLSARVVPVTELPDGTGGGKAGGLAGLVRLGLSVPPALVLLDADLGPPPDGIEGIWNDFCGGLCAVRQRRSS